MKKKPAKMFCGEGEGGVTPPHSCTKSSTEGEPWRQELLPFTEEDIISDRFAGTCWSLDIDYSQPVEVRRQQFRELMEREQREKEARR